MKSISPYQLWKFLSEEEQIPVSCIDGPRKYVDYRLSLFLAANGFKLRHIFISNDIETYMNIDDVHYLKAHVHMEDDKGEDIVMDLRPYYSGDEDEWALLMIDKEVDDIDIRFSLDVYKTEPLWIAALEGERRTLLTGDKMEWDMMRALDMELERKSIDRECIGVSEDEFDDLTAEAFDPDYDINDSPDNNWRNY